MFEKGKPAFHYNMANVVPLRDRGQGAPAPGKHTVVFDFKHDGGGSARAAPARSAWTASRWRRGGSERTTPFRFSMDETFDVGEDTGTPVSQEYDVPFAFTGQIDKLVIDLSELKLAVATTRDSRRGSGVRGPRTRPAEAQRESSRRESPRSTVARVGSG